MNEQRVARVEEGRPHDIIPDVERLAPSEVLDSVLERSQSEEPSPQEQENAFLLIDPADSRWI
jgi:hypothetical protein